MNRCCFGRSLSWQFWLWHIIFSFRACVYQGADGSYGRRLQYLLGSELRSC